MSFLRTSLTMLVAIGLVALAASLTNAVMVASAGKIDGIDVFEKFAIAI